MASRCCWRSSPLHSWVIDSGHLLHRQTQPPASFEIDPPEGIVNDGVDALRGFGFARLFGRTISTLATSIGEESLYSTIVAYVLLSAGCWSNRATATY